MKKALKKGFTLAELLIVVAIVSVLVAISVPMFHGKRDKAIEVTNKANIKTARDIAFANYLDGNYTKQVTVANFKYDWFPERKPNNPIYKRYTIRKRNGTTQRGAFYYFLDSNIFGWHSNKQAIKNGWKNDLTCEKVNGIYMNIYIDCYEDENGDLKLVSKPYVDDQGKVRYLVGENGQPVEEALKNPDNKKYDKETEEALNVSVVKYKYD